MLVPCFALDPSPPCCIIPWRLSAHAGFQVGWPILYSCRNRCGLMTHQSAVKHRWEAVSWPTKQATTSDPLYNKARSNRHIFIEIIRNIEIFELFFRNISKRKGHLSRSKCSRSKSSQYFEAHRDTTQSCLRRTPWLQHACKTHQEHTW